MLIATSASCGAHSLDVATPQAWKPGDGTAVAALFRTLRAKGVKAPGTKTAAAILPVTSCADDSTAGTLRSVISGAGDGDTIDLSGLSCGTITLTQGAIPMYLYSATLQGRGQQLTVIDGNANDRVFVHYGYGELRLTGLTVRNGLNAVSGYHVAGGACIVSNGNALLDHAAVTGCTAIGEGAYGGGILARGIGMYTSTLSGNLAQGSALKTLTASYGAGAFAYRGSVGVYDSTVSDNKAIPDPGNRYGSYDTGAGIFADVGGIAERSTFSNNYTDGTGGGIASHAGFVIVNSTISGNTAKKKAGGGIFTRASYALDIDSTTIADNTAARGAGLYIGGRPTAAIDLQSTIIANNHSTFGAADVSSQYGFTANGANNLIVAVENASLPGDTLHSDPKLLPLADNGGPTRTHALDAASPARDAGTNAMSLATDQRGVGFPRQVGSAPDIGAFEAPAFAPAAVLPAPAMSDGLLAWLAAALALFGIRRTRRR